MRVRVRVGVRVGVWGEKGPTKEDEGKGRCGGWRGVGCGGGGREGAYQILARCSPCAP